MKNFFKYMIIMGTMFLMVAPFTDDGFLEVNAHTNSSTTYNTYSTTSADTNTTTSNSASSSSSSSTSTSSSNTSASSASSSSQKPAEPVDTRVPNYTGQVGDYTERYFEWTSYDGRSTCYMNLYIDKNVYAYYRSLDRYYQVSDYDKYMNDKYSQEVVKALAKNLRDIQAKAGYSDYEMVLEAINFVQTCFAYQYDSDSRGEMEWPKYPLETVMDKGGDCEDTAMLLAAIIEEFGYGAVLLDYPGHIAAGVSCTNEMPGTYYNYNGKMYYYVETTGSGWKIGQVPDQYVGQPAEVYLF